MARAVRRRLPREKCPVDGCGQEVIVDRLMCPSCWKSLPLRARKFFDGRYYRLKPYLRRGGEFRLIEHWEIQECRRAARRVFRAGEMLRRLAGRIRVAKGFAPEQDRTLEAELKREGIL